MTDRNSAVAWLRYTAHDMWEAAELAWVNAASARRLGYPDAEVAMFRTWAAMYDSAYLECCALSRVMASNPLRV